MRPQVVVPLVLAAAVAALPACAGATAHRRATAMSQFERLKALEGRWESVEDSPMQGEVVYHVVGGGSAVEERLFPGEPHEMVTMYHMDGDRLVLTHYCAAGNQPSMRAAWGDDPSRIHFEFVRLGNGNALKDMHMHEAWLEFDGADRFRARWAGWEDGRAGAHEAELVLRRSFP